MKSDFFTFKIIWFALFSAPFAYLFILRIMFPEFSDDTSANNNINLMHFYIPATASVFAGFLFPKLLLHSLQTVTKQNLLVAMILRMVIFESIAIIGFVASIMTNNSNEYYPFLLVAILCMIKTMPTPTKWEQNIL